MSTTGVYGGPVLLFGSGETSASGRKAHDAAFAELKPPVRVAILETPAGFQPNSALVAGKIADFIRHNLQNYKPEIAIVPARRKASPYSPDDPELLAPMLSANYIFLGPGSPTYTVRHLRDTLAYRYLLHRHLHGASIALASAAAFAVSVKVLPVYELFKAGADLHWVDGLDLFKMYGLDLAIVPHWDNLEGGEDLDTSHGYVGLERFEQLRAMLSPQTHVLGIDEHTVVELDFAAGSGRVTGKGRATICRGDSEIVVPNGGEFDLKRLGPFHAASPPADFEPATDAEAAKPASLPTGATELLDERRIARQNKQWARSDELRARLAALGVRVEDTRDGQRWTVTGPAV